MSSDMSVLWLRAVIFALSVIGVGLFSGSETAFIASDRWIIDRLSKEGDKRAQKLKALIDRSSNTVSALLIGTNVFTVLASVMASSMAISLGLEEGYGVALVSLGTAAILFMFSELVPKVYAANAPTRVALLAATYLVVVTRILHPVSVLLSLVPRLLALIAGRRSSQEKVTPSDEPIRAALGLAEEDGLVDTEESQVMYSVLDSSDKTIQDIMVPIEKAVVIEPDATLRQAMELFRRQQFSRIPVLSSDRKKVIGTLYIKDVMRQVLKNPDELDRQCGFLARKPCLVMHNENVLDALSRLRKKRVHLAIVVKNEVPLGLVTLDDIIEEIVGDIPEDSPGLKRLFVRPEEDFLRAVSGSESGAPSD